MLTVVSLHLEYIVKSFQMRNFLLFLVPVLALQSTFALKNLEEPRWKSFHDAAQECADYLYISNETLLRYESNGYPDEPSDRKLLHCVALNLRAWDETLNQVKDNVFSQFFVPNTVDCQYKQHTKECLDQNVATLDPTDRLGRAYQSFQCYYKNYAGIKDEAQWVPIAISEVVQTIEDCLYYHNVANDSLLQFCQGTFATNPDYPDLAYCYFVRTGIYTRSTGFDLYKFYVQFGNDAVLADDTAKCVQTNFDQYCREPDRVVHSFLNCLLQYTPAQFVIAEATSNMLGHPPECVIPPSPPPQTQPCYNGPCP